MLHNWASAECIRFLRHMLVLEDSDTLRLLSGLGREELAQKKPFALTYSPTCWGRITISHEPIENRRWLTKFKREDYDEKTIPELAQVIAPRRLPVSIQFDKMKGAHFVKNGPDVLIDPTATSWEATWVDFGK